MRNGIDESLNLLRDLEFKLKSQPQPQQPLNLEFFNPNPSHPPKNTWGDKLVSAFQDSRGNLAKENKALKKYVNRLLKLNNYLKNQLVRKDHYRKQEEGSVDQISYLQMEVAWLHEISRQKQLQAQLYQKRVEKHERIKSQSTEISELGKGESRKWLAEKVAGVGKKMSGKKWKVKCPLCY